MILPSAQILSTLAVLMFAGCFQPSTGADEVEAGIEPPGQLFGADAGANSTCGDTAPTPLTKLHVVVLTSPFNGRYQPRNVGAIWVETAAGVFVKTLERWGKTRARYITRWNASSGGNVVDAVTSATLATHVTHDRTWNFTDKQTCKMPPGDYRVMIEHTDYNGTGALLQIPFTTTAGMQTVPDSTYFHHVAIDLQ
ncbi:MAG: DUF2271 domain-containing protein [Polyangiales bacterium]